MTSRTLTRQMLRDGDLICGVPVRLRQVNEDCRAWRWTPKSRRRLRVRERLAASMRDQEALGEFARAAKEGLEPAGPRLAVLLGDPLGDDSGERLHD